MHALTTMAWVPQQRFFQLSRGAFFDASWQFSSQATSTSCIIAHSYVFLCYKKMVREGRRGMIWTQLADVGLTGLEFWNPDSCFKK